jgi:hypothetical protein
MEVGKRENRRTGDGDYRNEVEIEEMGGIVYAKGEGI